MQPLTDEQIWGYPERPEPSEQDCPLRAGNSCPAGCRECERYAEEMKVHLGVANDE